jgi:antitoxin HicB
MNDRGYKIDIQPLSPALGGGFRAIVPELKGCASDGATTAEARRNALGAIESWIAAAEAAGQMVPLPPRRRLLRGSPQNRTALRA